VRLTGTVPSNEARLTAAIVARSTPGTRAVRDELELKSD
jgi:osmotically-inducible protein OsmY